MAHKSAFSGLDLHLAEGFNPLREAHMGHIRFADRLFESSVALTHWVK